MAADNEKRDEVLKRLLKTPPTPHTPEKVLAKKKPNSATEDSEDSGPTASKK